MFGRRINFGGVFADTRKGGERRRAFRYNLPIFGMLCALIAMNLVLAGIIFQQRLAINNQLAQTRESISDELAQFNRKMIAEAEEKAKISEQEKEKEEELDTGTGIIEGSLSYPGQYIPKNMEICAVDATTEEEFCTKEQLSGNYTFGVGYKIEVPVGDYQVYAKVPEWAGYKAYYSEFVKCGSQAGCSDHTPVTIEVTKDETTSKIDPTDWYDI